MNRENYMKQLALSAELQRRAIEAHASDSLNTQLQAYPDSIVVSKAQSVQDRLVSDLNANKLNDAEEKIELTKFFVQHMSAENASYIISKLTPDKIHNLYLQQNSFLKYIRENYRTLSKDEFVVVINAYLNNPRYKLGNINQGPAQQAQTQPAAAQPVTAQPAKPRRKKQSATAQTAQSSISQYLASKRQGSPVPAVSTPPSRVPLGRSRSLGPAQRVALQTDGDDSGAATARQPDDSDESDGSSSGRGLKKAYQRSSKQTAPKITGLGIHSIRRTNLKMIIGRGWSSARCNSRTAESAIQPVSNVETKAHKWLMIHGRAVDMGKLRDGYLTIAVDGRALPEFSNLSIDSATSEVLLSILEIDSFDGEAFDGLEDRYKDIIKRACDELHLDLGLTSPLEEKWTLVTGEIAAGNTNSDLVEEYRSLVKQYFAAGKLNEKQYLQMMTQI